MFKKLLQSFYTYADKTIFCIWRGQSHLDRKMLPCEQSWLRKDETIHCVCHLAVTKKAPQMESRT